MDRRADRVTREPCDLLAQPRILRVALPRRRRHLCALPRLVRRQSGYLEPAPAGRGEQELCRLHGRRRCRSGKGQRVIRQGRVPLGGRSEEHTSELQSLLRISYAVFCLKKKKNYRIK